MNLEHRMLALLMRARALLIVFLSVASGWTTWKGLQLFIDWPIALGLTAAVQTILVIATYQLSKMYLAASARRYLAVAFGLTAAFCVSVFFSYFTFYAHNEGGRVAQRKFAETRKSIELYVTQVLDARAKFLANLEDKMARLEREEQDALEGRMPDVRPGVGPIYLSLKALAEEAGRSLRRETEMDELKRSAEELSAILAVLSASDAAPGGGAYEQLQNRLLGLENAYQNWLIARAGAQTRVTPPALVPRSEYLSVRPSPSDLSRLSPVALSLAVLVDLFTVLLTWWLESVPFGDLSAEYVVSACSAIWEFAEWRINRNGQLEFLLTRTDDERFNGYNDVGRLFWAAYLLSLGLLRRAGADRCEFTPRLYPLFSSSIYPSKGATNGICNNSDIHTNSTAAHV